MEPPDGKTLVSSDGLKVYRPPSAKPNSPYATTGVQANFERKAANGGRPISNGHLDILTSIHKDHATIRSRSPLLGVPTGGRTQLQSALMDRSLGY